MILAMFSTNYFAMCLFLGQILMFLSFVVGFYNDESGNKKINGTYLIISEKVSLQINHPPYLLNV